MVKLLNRITFYILFLLNFTVYASNLPLLELRSGVLIDNTCNDIITDSFAKTVDQTIEEGLQCLKSLNTNASRKNAETLEEMLNTPIAQDRLKVLCSLETNLFQSTNWDAQAFASASKKQTQKLNQQTIEHPFIALRPESLSWNNQLKKLIFHEFIHNLGYRHGIEREFSNTCEECCFGKDDWENMSVTDAAIKKQELACQLCANNYTTDKAYVEDAIAWSRGSNDSWIVTTYILNKIKTSESELYYPLLLKHLNEKYPELIKSLNEINLKKSYNNPQSKISHLAAKVIVSLKSKNEKLAGKHWNSLKVEIRQYTFSNDKSQNKFSFIQKMNRLLTATKQVIPFKDIIFGFKVPQENSNSFLNSLIKK